MSSILWTTLFAVLMAGAIVAMLRNLGWTRDGWCYMDWPRKPGLSGQALSLLPGGCQPANSQMQFLGIVESRSVAIPLLQKEKGVNLRIYAEPGRARRRRCNIGGCGART